MVGGAPLVSSVEGARGAAEHSAIQRMVLTSKRIIQPPMSVVQRLRKPIKGKSHIVRLNLLALP